MKKIVFLVLIFTQMTYGMTGLEVGTEAPDIELTDTAGNTVNFSKEVKNTVVVFYRGAWCPYCLRQLDSIQKEVFSKLDEKSQLVSISVDRLPVAKKMKDKQGYNFRVVSDSKAKSLKAFNIINKLDDELVQKYKASYKIDVEGDSGETHHMVAHPAVFVIKNGKITFADVHTDYKKRTKNSEILKAL